MKNILSHLPDRIKSRYFFFFTIILAAAVYIAFPYIKHPHLVKYMNIQDHTVRIVEDNATTMHDGSKKMIDGKQFIVMKIMKNNSANSKSGTIIFHYQKTTIRDSTYGFIAGLKKNELIRLGDCNCGDIAVIDSVHN